ncbi:acetyl-CoA carboxylase, carboxyltransferase subunit beta [Campylobacter canadensis]|uniref:Acetyl-coenzyme A carboxylase carboxyl transferase subunit beta n=1 Tax=Campylobacter canadensis TaxID=449520 RepID=A0ABS7WTC2_9BACT|nr:acetyl-CoA carboxylase, carboxyltransferase subunit beta [Campylobacter canadensis]MBZ7988013.1 acetyl-CoA carboxylase carboxyltransferase subunit beta [Campylobacter canadensis]MBZ7995442.1 acetyl-CoA carboxylase carboxyltransferase subunit beta [Campylobacter canadensis]MBZ7997240.1 acetyl-CoA carboxylase carboxyltransferase subunit beta [Campylobacter canadensis]MBZ7998971.1 acetyl-CoA carboxylase carboxyltransferase subunit beta [Campylobacter canadensis]MBZ8000795.1 acetyl-CoA carboxyl
MSFADIFKIRKTQSKPNEAPNHWVKCDNCHSLMYYKEVTVCFNVCPKCGLHMKLSPQERINMLVDEGSFVEFDNNLRANDPLKFVDSKSYKKRLSESEEKTGRYSAIISGECKINGIGAQLCVFDFSFMGGSLGSVEGEKINRAVQRAIMKKEGLIIISASGGARMQESTYSLMQMAKTSAALKLLAQERLPYISLLTNPTFGGVSASFAWLGDLVIAEPMAQIGFAGARVIKQTIGAELPEGFQSAEFLLEHGLLDAIVKRSEQKDFIANFLEYFK